MNEAEQIKLLIDALIHFKSQITTAAFSNMGFLIITLGWLLTSIESRKFLGKHKSTTNIFILLIVGIFVGFIILNAKLYHNTEIIASTLEGYSSVEPSLYEHYKISFIQMIFFNIFELLVCTMVISVLLSIKKMKINQP